MTEDLAQLKSSLQQAREEISKVIIGQEQVIDLMLITILTGQHALLEGVPGVAKTLMVRTLAKVLGADFNRIQFTPDLMPTDITGTNIFNLQTNTFDLVKGPVFTSFLLGDEINRAPAKTQSALLQAMQERCVTIDRTTHELPSEFTVFATQNPVEYEGTYPLPEAQKDRFLLKINMECPLRDEEIALATRMLGQNRPEQALASGEVKSVLTVSELNTLRPALDSLTVRPELISYTVDIVRQTREQESILVGAGPRATQGLILAARARAAFDERDFVSPDDIKDMVPHVLGHRLILRPEYEIEGLTVTEVIQTLLEQVAVPR